MEANAENDTKILSGCLWGCGWWWLGTILFHGNLGRTIWTLNYSYVLFLKKIKIKFKSLNRTLKTFWKGVAGPFSQKTLNGPVWAEARTTLYWIINETQDRKRRLVFNKPVDNWNKRKGTIVLWKVFWRWQCLRDDTSAGKVLLRNCLPRNH